MASNRDRTKAGFPSTCWTLVVSLKEGQKTSSRDESLSQICETYWFPLYSFARHRGRSSHDAEDAVQGFLTSVVTGDYLARADHEKGKLRTFLLTGFTRYLKDLNVQKNALKRGGQNSILSLDLMQAEEWLEGEEIQDTETSLDFEREWALTTMRTAISQIEKQENQSGKSSARFKILSRFLTPQSCDGFTREEAANRLEISPDACDKAIQRLRLTFRETVRELVAGTLVDPSRDAIKEEMEQLQRALL